MIEAKFWNLTSYAIPNPPRIEVFPVPVGSNANPIRGPMLFRSVFGFPKVITPGTFEMEFKVCVLSPTGFVQNS